jgi:hypothetical protein
VNIEGRQATLASIPQEGSAMGSSPIPLATFKAVKVRKVKLMELQA